MLFEMARICPFSGFIISILTCLFVSVSNFLPVISITFTGKVSLDEG